MRFEYHPDVDALYIHLSPGSPRAKSEGGSTVVVGDGFAVDVDEDGVPVGIDIYQDASKIVDLSRLEAESPVFGLVPTGDAGRGAG
jgi:uncharacterized protein YuzE